jgi:hypothetical protein
MGSTACNTTAPITIGGQIFKTRNWSTEKSELLEFEVCCMCITIKQWPPDSEFIEFEYLPEICHFWQI